MYLVLTVVKNFLWTIFIQPKKIHQGTFSGEWILLSCYVNARNTVFICLKKDNVHVFDVSLNIFFIYWTLNVL